MYLGLDMGTSAIKALLMREDQSVIASATAELSISRPKAGWSEQNPQDWCEAVVAALAVLKKTHARDLSMVQGIGLSGQMHGAVLLGSGDEVLRPAILWNDTRTYIQAARLDADTQFRKLTGNIVFPGFTAPKLVWVKENEPEIFARVRKVLLPKDYLRLWLSGEYISDMSDASGTSWLNTAERRWSPELLDKTEMRVEQMPDLVEGTDQAGRLRSEIAELLGLPSGIIIAGGGGDNAVSACGVGTVSANRTFISLGTSGVLFTANDTYRPNADSAVHSFCHVLPDTWHQMGVILSAADSLNWFAKINEKKAADLTAELGNALKTPGLVRFLPYLAGERTPHNDALVRGSFVGLAHGNSRADLTQAILEGVAFAFRDNFEALLAAGTRIESAIAIGGGSRSQYWLTSIATILNIPVEVPKDGDYGAAFGAARLGMIATHKLNPVAVCTPPAIGHIIEPVKNLRAAYEDAYHNYRSIYPALKQI
ncbi:xylulokinase [Paenochrobactrum gallinarii]|uniref:Xylulose kinase n=1 Tax=Paenochrobactrum gallinarii TaxID=643673 RepID=A0A841M6Z9_9HYPH|nr:xylulokinase [Paenochrobactrum gallinarii]MBB6261918.1 xylulokinase [Paenochrobactrum gallinarii]